MRHAWVSSLTDWGAAIYASAVPGDLGLLPTDDEVVGLSVDSALLHMTAAAALLVVVIILSRPAAEQAPRRRDVPVTDDPQ